MKKSEATVLADVYEDVRSLSKLFISALKDIDKDKILELNGVKFNNAYWIVAHLVWSEHFLIIQGVAGDNLNIDWINEYGFGSKPENIKIKPSFDEIIKTLDEVHSAAVKIISELSDEQLDEENLINANFGSANSKRAVIKHAIRHEPMHIGQLSWILKTYGISFA